MTVTAEDVGVEKRPDKFARARFGAACAAASVLMLIPCFWQARIQAGDLSSHLYNAWLAQLIQRGEAPGLHLAWQSNNVLFDLILSGLMAAFDAAAAQRIAVSIAVLVFFWGAFAFVWSRSRQSQAPWHLAPCVAMLAYGWVFHMGLFNFYISLGLSFAALALARRRGRLVRALAMAVLGIAYVAHALPVAWAIGVLVYEAAARRLPPRLRIVLLIVVVAGTGMLGAVLASCFHGHWFGSQLMALTGVEQTWVFSARYALISVALLVVWIFWFQRVLAARGTERTLLDIRFQLCLLCAVGAVLIPDAILLPGMRHTLNALAERMSLGTAVMFLSLAASLRPRRADTVGIAAIAALFFGFLYADQGALNGLESQMADVVSQIPPGQRVISVLTDPEARVNCLTHMIDRVCLGKCFSYANYEPSTAQFRVRADSPNGIVAWDYGQSWGMQAGGYVAEPRDLPLYKVGLCQNDGSHPGARVLCVSPVMAGSVVQTAALQVLPQFVNGKAK